MFRDIFKLYPEEKLFYGPLTEKDRIVAYNEEIERNMAEFCHSMFTKFVSDSIVFKCTTEVQATGRAKL